MLLTSGYNQNLPPIPFQKFPLFKQCFKCLVTSREDMGDEIKMAQLLQFLDGKAKETVSSLETVTGAIHHAFQILAER